MFTRVFWKAAAERAVKTAGQTLLASLALASSPLDVLHVNWVGALSVTGGAALLSLLTSLSGLSVGPAGTPAAVARNADTSTSMGPDA